jgi:hypothetical protein
MTLAREGVSVGSSSNPPGEETQWDWVEPPNPPASSGLGETAYVLVGCCLIRAAAGRGWPNAPAPGIWSRVWIRWCAGWAG